MLEKIFLKLKKNIFENQTIVKVLKNSSWLVGDRVFTMILGVFVTAIVARYFGPDKYGQFNYALSFVALFTAISTLGLETLTVKSILTNDYDEGTILFTSFIIRIIGGVLLTLLASLIIRIIDPNDSNLHFLVLIMSITMIFKSFEVIEYWIQAYQKAKISSLIRIAAYIVFAGLKLMLVFYKGNLVQYTFIYALDALIVGLALIIAYYFYREKKVKWRFNFKYMKYILSQSWYLVLSGLMITMYMQVDKIMLGNMFVSKSEVGIYSVASQAAQMWYFVPMAIIVSFKPVIMRQKLENQDKYLKSIQLLYTIIAWLGIIFGIFIVFSSNLIINILFGEAYLKAASILSISVWAGTFAILGSARSIWLVSEGLHRYTLIYTLIGLMTNLLLNYLLIPSMGGHGAAIATLISQFAANILALLPFKATRISSIMLIKSFSPINLIKTIRNDL